MEVIGEVGLCVARARKWGRGPGRSMGSFAEDYVSGLWDLSFYGWTSVHFLIVRQPIGALSLDPLGT